MGKLYVVIDVGCHECGVDSEVVGTYRTPQTAEKAAQKRSAETGDWREGGQSIPQVFEITPNDKEG